MRFLDLFGAIKKMHRSKKSSGFFDQEHIFDVDNVIDVIPTAASDRIIDHVSKLPNYVSVFDNSSNPLFWYQAEELDQLLILIDESRRSYIVGPVGAQINGASLAKIVSNLNNHVHPYTDTIRVTQDLYDKLRSISEGGGSKERLQIIKSQALSRFRGWLHTAIKMGASDIHFETENEYGYIRVRVDGEMWPLNDSLGGKYPATQIKESISSAYQNLTLQSSNSASLWQEDNDSYTMLSCELDGKTINLRFQSTNGVNGPKAVLRVFESNDKPSRTLQELGYAKSQLKEIYRAQQTTTGVVLFCGITGSGKTTAIRSFLEYHPENGKIVINTIEDPVEMTIKGAHQTSIQRSFDDADEDTTKKYVGAIAALLRSDIDIGMLGELRDSITANAWLNIGETGHMGIGTLHAHRLTGIIPRLTNKTMGLSRQVICTPQTINMFVYQSLVPSLCTECSLTTDEFLASTEADTSTVDEISSFCSKLELDISKFKWRNLSGCSCCNYRGTSGQELVAEILTPDDRWLDLIRDGKDIEAAEYHRSRGVMDLYSEDLTCRSIVEHCLLKVFDKKIDLRTISRFEKMNDFADKFIFLKKKFSSKEEI